MHKYVVTPWKNDEEILMVRRLLFGNRGNESGVGGFSKDKRSHAVKLVGTISLMS